MFLLEAFFCYLVADFLSGLIHWWEDRYITSSSPSLLGKYVGEPNERHHSEPNYFLQFSYFNRVYVSVVISLIVGLAFWMIGIRDWQVYFVLLVLSQSNQIHAWAHQGRSQNGPFVTFLQRTGFLQSTKHHAKHHGKPHTFNYCILTNWLNPVLEKIHFWAILEKLLAFFFKVQPQK